MAPVFHRSRTKGQADNGLDGETDDNDLDNNDDEWTRRKCSATSLDTLVGGRTAGAPNAPARASRKAAEQ